MNKAYTSYAPINQKWAKEIPSHWDAKRMKAVFAMRKERNNPIVTENILSLTAKQGVVPYAEKEETGGNKPKSDLTQYNVCHENDLLVNCMNVVSGAAGVSKYYGAISPVYYAFYPHNDENIWYYHYIFRLLPFQRSLVGLGKGILMHESEDGTLTSVRMRISMDYLGNVLLPVPPRVEQDQIVRFLDWKVSSINKLIGVRKKQIAEYEALRKRIILSSVTHGLNKVASVEKCEEQWIAEMPTHWRLLPIKRLFKIFSGATPQSGNSEYWNGDIVWITPADFKTKDHYIYQGKKNLTDSGFSACSTSMVPPDSIVFSKRAPVGTVAINKVDLCTNQGCLSCVPYEGVSSEFFYYVMSVCTEEFERRAAGTTFKEISLTAFGSFLMPVPPIDEQREIVNYLEKTCRDVHSCY